MQHLPPELVASFELRLDHDRVPQAHRPDYHKWVRFYLYFCQKYGFPPTAPASLGPFLTKLLGHTDIKTTMIYLQTVPTLTLKQAKSPLDCL